MLLVVTLPDRRHIQTLPDTQTTNKLNQTKYTQCNFYKSGIQGSDHERRQQRCMVWYGKWL